ncbi:MAG: alpha/beta fold hydrolase [Ilumatobacter sp.]
MTRAVFAHGFTQTGRSWDLIVEGLGGRLEDLDPLAPDLPGHGDAAAVEADLWSSADVLVEAGRRAAYIGYSMGGRTALHAALAHPEQVEFLVLIGATAGIEDERGRAERREADEALADRIQEIGVAAFLDQWLTNPLFAGLSEDAAGRPDRLRNTPAGLASSLRLAGTGTQTPLWDRLGEVRCPTLVLVGEHDEKFRALGERMVASMPEARLDVIAASGHSVHLEQPEATIEALAGFLA